MRVMALQGQEPEDQRRFAEFCLSVGEDRVLNAESGSGLIPIPPSMLSSFRTAAELCFGSDPALRAASEGRSIIDLENFLSGRCIVTPYNADVDDFNEATLSHFPGQVRHASVCPWSYIYMDLACISFHNHLD